MNGKSFRWLVRSCAIYKGEDVVTVGEKQSGIWGRRNGGREIRGNDRERHTVFVSTRSTVGRWNERASSKTHLWPSSCVSRDVHTQSSVRGQGREPEMALSPLSPELVVLEEAQTPAATPDLGQRERERLCSFTYAYSQI